MKPSAQRNEIRIETGALEIRVTAPAAEGKANSELERFLSKRLGLSRSSVTVVRGQTSRHKVVEVLGLDRESVLRRLTA